MFELVFLTGARAGEVVPVTKSLIGGRSPDCSLEVPDPNASRQHARFLWDGAALTVADNGSANGTFVNEQRVTAPRPLGEGDVVRLGETRLRAQACHASTIGNSSSIFGFKEAEVEAEADLSQSILLSASEVRSQGATPEMLAARLNAVIEVSKALVNINDLAQVFDGILETLFKVFPQADRGFLMLGNDAAKLIPRAMRQRGKGVTENLMVSTSICRKALESKRAFLFNDQNAGDFDQGMSIVSLHIRSAMTIPLMIGDEVLGLLQVDTPDRNRAFNIQDLELAVAVSQQAAIALHNAQLLAKVKAETTQRDNLLRFLPGPLADQVLSGNMDLAMGGKTYAGTIMFSDLIGFTRISETMPPDQLVALLNGFFNRMVPCVQNHAGSVDKYMGDAIMAVWGVPINKGDAAANAVNASLSMQIGLAGFNSLQAKEHGSQLNMGIGLNSGPMVAGNIGHEDRKEYTVLGDTVNTAQRLETWAGKSQVLVSAATWGQLGGHGFGVALPPLKVKNKAEALAAYSIRGLRVVGDEGRRHTPADGHDRTESNLSALSDEVMLYLPVRSGAHPAYLIRRLTDHSFIIIHGADCDICAELLVTDLVEWPGMELGKPEMVALLPTQNADGCLMRSNIRLADDSLQGLLGSAPIACTRVWEDMPRYAGV